MSPPRYPSAWLRPAVPASISSGKFVVAPPLAAVLNLRFARHRVASPIYSFLLNRPFWQWMSYRNRSPFSSNSTNCSASEGKSVRFALFRQLAAISSNIPKRK